MNVEMTGTKEEHIQLPPPVVWELMTDPDGWTEWIPDARRVEATTSGGVREGAEFYVNPSQGALASRAVLTVEEFEPPEHIVLEIRDTGKLQTTLDAMNREASVYHYIFELSQVLNDPSATRLVVSAEAEVSKAQRWTATPRFVRTSQESNKATALATRLARYLGAYLGHEQQRPSSVDPLDMRSQWSRFARLTTYSEQLRTKEGSAEARAALDAFIASPDRYQAHVDFILRVMAVYPPWLADRYGSAFARRQAMRALERLDTWRSEAEWLRAGARPDAIKLSSVIREPDVGDAWADLVDLVANPDALTRGAEFEALFDVLMRFVRGGEQFREHVRFISLGLMEWPRWIDDISIPVEPDLESSQVITNLKITDSSSQSKAGAPSVNSVISAEHIASSSVSSKGLTRTGLERAAKAYLRQRSGTDWWKAAGRRVADLTEKLEKSSVAGFELELSFLPLIVSGPAKGRPGYVHYVVEAQLLVNPRGQVDDPDSVTVGLDFEFVAGSGFVHKVHPDTTIDVIGERTSSHTDSMRNTKSKHAGVSMSVPGVPARATAGARSHESIGTVDSDGLKYQVEQVRVDGYAIGSTARWVFTTTDRRAATGGYLIAAEVLAADDVRDVAISGSVDVDASVSAQYRTRFTYELPMGRNPAAAPKGETARSERVAD